MTPAESLTGLLCGLVILGLLIFIGVSTHLAYTKLDVMLEHLKNCSAVTKRAPLKHGGPLGKFLLVGAISGIVTFPGIYLKHGGVNTEDLRNFPPSLKQKLATLQWIVWGLFTMLAILIAIAESGLLY
ncbi:hypothetical protein [Pseudomonas sp. PD9R]|uniref:hypothetical protein n=1 Tax=Pseudomonas sp. PD9R TaxID=2853534 RepID=UPI001C4432E7|nr:hypothetical protein [Pseudomonas sp. PD9R]MBV6825821.1 hypothetical protein [Pseudomonas sp. PD9R]